MIVFLLAVLAPAQVAAAPSGKVALVIGNAKYAEVPVLKNPERDAVDIAAALNEIGFDVTVELNAGIDAFIDALDAFQQKADSSEIAIIYYAGHGIEFQNSNYLVPVDAVLEKESQIRIKTLELERLEQAVKGAKKLRMVFLDACRNDPFADRIQTRNGRKRSVAGRGLAKIEPSDGTVIAYSAKGGTTASDGEGRNSPYTAALLKYVHEPNLDVDKMLRLVRDDVLKATNHEQEPFIYGSLPAETLSLNAKAVAGDVQGYENSNQSSGHEAATIDPLHDVAKDAWDAVKDSKLRSDFETFVGLFPNTFYAKLAHNRIAVLDNDTRAASASPEVGGHDVPVSIDVPAVEPKSWFLAVYPDVDFYGGDLVQSGLRTQSVEQCAMFCGNDVACRMFTYNTRANKCFLKSGYEVAQRASDAIGGVFYKGTRNEQRLVRAEWEFLPSADINGYDIGATRDTDYASCFASCRANAQCQGVSFVGKVKRDRCWLKGGNTNGVIERKGVVSARRIEFTVTPRAILSANAKD